MPQITRQVAAEGVSRVVVVTDEPDKYPLERGLRRRASRSATATSSTRCSASCARSRASRSLVYDQTCAAEKRRRRKRGQHGRSAAGASSINELVCEGCGDCGRASNCVSVVPLETEFGRKRQIDQSACNKDFSCLKGFCPSFVTVEGGQPAQGGSRAGCGSSAPADAARAGPARSRRAPMASWSPASAAPASSPSARCSAWPRTSRARASPVLDMAGLAQKGGAVHEPHPHRRRPGGPPRPCASRPAAPTCCSAATWSSPPATRRWRSCAPGQGHARGQHPSDDDRRLHPPAPTSISRPRRSSAGVVEAAAPRAPSSSTPSRLATALLGDASPPTCSCSASPGRRAWCRCRAAAIEQAIELNGVAVGINRQAFRWGRRGRPRSGRGRGARAAPVTPATDAAPGREPRRAVARRGRVPHRLPGRGLRRALPRAGRAGAAGRGRARAGPERARRGGRAQPLQAAGLQGRVRGRAALHRRRVPARSSRAVRGRTKLRFHLAPPLLARARPASGELKSAPTAPGC